MRRAFLPILVSAAMAFQNVTAQTNAPRFRLMTLDPGHFHAALVQKFSYADVDPVVHVYAPDGDDLGEHLKRIASFNTRTNQPTHWREEVYSQPDFFEKMLADKPGNIVVLAGKSAKKADYILRSVQDGLNVLADKPMVVRPEDLPKLREAFTVAASNHVLLYDIMTERYEITTLLQREFSRQAALFGQLEKGTPENPAVQMESVHYISKIVAGAPLRRPKWFFDTGQTGDGITDVTTHLVDLVQFEAFPELALSPDDVTVINARRWMTPITLKQFKQVTGAAGYPEFLLPYLKNGVLEYHGNGEITWRLRDVYARISVVWNFEPPPGGGDSLHSVLRGTRATLEIRQGSEQNYKPLLYVAKAGNWTEREFDGALADAVKSIEAKYPGLKIRQAGREWEVVVPEKYEVGHEAHFAQVTENYLSYLRAGRLPDWEVPGMLTKYMTTMRACEMSR